MTSDEGVKRRNWLPQSTYDLQAFSHLAVMFYCKVEDNGEDSWMKKVSPLASLSECIKTALLAIYGTGLGDDPVLKWLTLMDDSVHRSTL